MKTLKTIFILLALVCANSSFAQTENETITWLKEKFENNVNLTGDVTVSVTVCEIKIWDERQSVNRDMRYTFSPSDVDYIGYDGRIYFKAKTFHIYGEMMGVDYDKYQEASQIRDYFAGFRIEEKEVDIISRMNTALKHLATFCPKKKETF